MTPTTPPAPGTASETTAAADQGSGHEHQQALTTYWVRRKRADAATA